jgi:quinol---cytochrome c reductase cytochrome c subunit, bacillus type
MSAIDERRALFAKYKADVKSRGKPFFPNAMFHDTVMSLVVVVIIIVLAVVWYETTGDTANGDKAVDKPGLLGKVYDDKADPGTFSFVPRPDWYFYFLFYLLRIFKWPDSVILGTVGIPTICLILLLAVPFIDRRTERRLSRRPVAVVASILVVISMGVLTWKGATATESLAKENLTKVPSWIKTQHMENNPAAKQGALLFAQIGCLNCHSYLGSGGGYAGAPDLSAEGAKNKGIKFQIDHLKCPSCVNPGSPMPQFVALGNKRLAQLAAFLEASKGGK